MTLVILKSVFIGITLAGMLSALKATVRLAWWD